MQVQGGTLVTIVIDTYNTGHLVERAIGSVLEQIYPAELLDVLVVDDGSTDNTEAVVQRYARRVRYIRQSNGGQASALNTGIRNARGEIICLLDGDDYFYPEKVMRVAEVFQRQPLVGLVHTRYDIVGIDGKVIRRGCPSVLEEGDLEGITLLGYSSSSVTSALALRASIARGVEIPDKAFRFSADYFLVNILPLMARVGAVQDPLSAWVAHGANALLSNPVRSPPQLNRQHRAAILEYAERRLGKRFITYLGRAGMGEGIAYPAGLPPLLNTWFAECMAIARTNVHFGLKLRAEAKLVASLLPVSGYSALRGSRLMARWGHPEPAEEIGASD